MNKFQLFIMLLAIVSVAAQSCTSDPVELLAPETRERITQAIGVDFMIAPHHQEVWSNLIWKEDESWEQHPLGKIYPNQTDWMTAIWIPGIQQLKFNIKYEVIDFSSLELHENNNCGLVESIHTYEDADWYNISYRVDDEFVDCLDGTGDQIILDMIILLK